MYAIERQLLDLAAITATPLQAWPKMDIAYHLHEIKTYPMARLQYHHLRHMAWILEHYPGA
jgi:hypothetical protein